MPATALMIMGTNAEASKVCLRFPGGNAIPYLANCRSLAEEATVE